MSPSLFCRVSLVFLLVSLFSVCVCCSASSSLSDVRSSVLSLMLWPSPAELPTLIQHVKANISLLDNSCHYTDLNYSTRGRENWDPILHMFRLEDMVRSVSYPQSPYYNDTYIIDIIHCGLGVWIKEDWQNPNWWWNTIQDNIVSSGILLMMGTERLSDDELSSLLTFSYRADWWRTDWGGGANLVWELQVQLFTCLATNNETGVEQAFNLMWQTVTIQNYSGQGIMPDYSYHFHGLQLLTGAYGTAWAWNILHFWMSSRGTQYQLPYNQLTLFATYLTEGDAWFTHGDYWDFGVVGRILDRQLPVWYSQLFKPDELRILADAVNSNETLSRHVREFADRLEALQAAVPLVGNRHSYTSDYHTHRRSNWTAALKLHSIRTIPTECDNSENMKGEHLADGVLNLYTRHPQTGRQEEYHTVFPIIDWKALNGITVEYNVPILFCNGQYPVRKTSFVGGVSDGWTGLTYMDTATHNLTAKRSWYFHDNLIIALANEINLDNISDSVVSTALASRLLPSPQSIQGAVTVAYTNGSIVTLTDGVYQYAQREVAWFHTDAIGYWVTAANDQAQLVLDIRVKTANSLELGPWNYTVTGRVFSARLIHRQSGQTQRMHMLYTYLLLPNISVLDMGRRTTQLQQEGVVQCASLQSQVDPRNISQQVVSHATLVASESRASLVLWDDVSSSSPPVVYQCTGQRGEAPYSVLLSSGDAGGYAFHEESDTFTVTASHPTRLSASLSLFVDRVSVETGWCRAANMSGLSGTRVAIALPTSQNLLGLPISTTCQKRTTRLRHE